MLQTFAEKLVTTTTEDGLTLHGVALRPTRPRRSLAVVWVHGLTGNFVKSMPLARSVAERGYVVVDGNNRGHDFGALFRRPDAEPLLAGGGWERFDESPHDIAAWIALAVAQGFPGVVLVGHSLGALKVGYYQATRHDPRVLGIVVASPPLRATELNVDLVVVAERLVAEGHGKDLLPWGSTNAGAGTVSGQTYLNRVRTNLDVFGFVTPNPRSVRITEPILAFYGSNEPEVGGQAELNKIQVNAPFSPSVETHIIDGANHSYSGREEEVGALIASWAEKLGRGRRKA